MKLRTTFREIFRQMRLEQANKYTNSLLLDDDDDKNWDSERDHVG
jgi:hypothetical protein